MNPLLRQGVNVFHFKSMETHGSAEVIKVLKLDCHDFASLLKARLFGARSVSSQNRITIHKIWQTGFIAHAKRLDTWNRNKASTQHPTKLRQIVCFGDYSTPFTLFTEVVTKCNSLIYQLYSVAVRILVPKYSMADRADQFDMENYRASNIRATSADQCNMQELEFLFLADESVDTGTAGILAAMHEVFQYTKDMADEVVFIEDNSSKDNKSRYRFYGLAKLTEFDDFRENLTVLNTVSDHSGNRGDSSHWTNRLAMSKLLAEKIGQNKQFEAPTTARDLVELFNQNISSPGGSYKERQIKKRVYYELNEALVNRFKIDATSFEIGGTELSEKLDGISRCSKFCFPDGKIEGYFDVMARTPFLSCVAL